MSDDARGATDADVIVMGAGLAGLVAAAEMADAGERVIIVEQEPGEPGRAGVLVVRGAVPDDSPEQRRLGIRDSFDWRMRTGWGRPVRPPGTLLASPLERGIPGFAVGEKRAWLYAQGLRFFPVVGWAERGGYGASAPAIRCRGST